MSSLIGPFRRCLMLSLASLMLLALAPAASSASNPIARATCVAPGLSCAPCPDGANNCPLPRGDIKAGASVRFDGSSSSDDRGGAVNGKVAAWKWSFGDGATATGAQVSHVFRSGGFFTVVLTVTDDKALSDTFSLRIGVGPASPGTSTSPTCSGRPATVVAVAGERVVKGTPGDDVIVGSDSADAIDSGAGNDTICAGKGNDTVRGGSGKDRISGDGGDDLLLGGNGDDEIRGGSGKDRSGGGSGNDRVDGGPGNDLLDERKLGGKGRDRLIGGSGADSVRTADRTSDSIDCGSGRDSVLMDARDRQKSCESVRRAR